MLENLKDVLVWIGHDLKNYSRGRNEKGLPSYRFHKAKANGIA